MGILEPHGEFKLQHARTPVLTKPLRLAASGLAPLVPSAPSTPLNKLHSPCSIRDVCKLIPCFMSM